MNQLNLATLNNTTTLHSQKFKILNQIETKNELIKTAVQTNLKKLLISVTVIPQSFSCKDAKSHDQVSVKQE